MSFIRQKLATVRSIACIVAVALSLTGFVGVVEADELIASNDNFADAIEFAQLPYMARSTAVLATTEPEERICTYIPLAQKSVWYKFTPSAETELKLVQTNQNVTIGMYTGTSLADLKVVACGSPYSYSPYVTAKAGTTYYIQLSAQVESLAQLEADLLPVSTISGRTTDQSGAPVSTCVTLLNADGIPKRSTSSSSLGLYRFRDFPDGEYKVRFGCTWDLWVAEYFDDTPVLGDARVLQVTPGSRITGIDASLLKYGVIKGRVTNALGDVLSTCVSAFAIDGVETSGYSYGGHYQLRLHGGEYRVRFGCLGSANVIEYYNDKSSLELAEPVNVLMGQEVAGIDAVVGRHLAPPNDDFANAHEVTSLPSTQSTIIASATTETDESRTCNELTNTAWYKYTADQDSDVVIDAAGSEGSVVLAAYTANSLSGLDQRACSASGPGPVPMLAFHATAGEIFYIQAGQAWPGAAFSLKLNFDRATGRVPHTFDAPIPCATSCPYWDQTRTDPQQREDSCLPSPPSVQGSWDDLIITVPESMEGRVPDALMTHLSPGVDFDGWLCRASPDASGKYYITSDANIPTDQCAAGPIGCKEDMVIPVKPGETYVFRAYNWSDSSLAQASYSFRLVRD